MQISSVGSDYNNSQNCRNITFGKIKKNEINKVLKFGPEGIKEKFLCIVSAPSGTGKDSIINKFNEQYDYFTRIVTCTTRKPRPGEVNGVNYNFLTQDEFQKGVENGDFLEYCNVFGDRFYGTRKKDVETALATGKNAILVIDVDGAMQVKKNRPDALMMFFTPPSMKELASRLINRGTETMDAIAERLGKASYELGFKNKYDIILQNDDLAESVNELGQIFKLK